MDADKHLKALQEKGVRITPQRTHVWRVLIESRGHLTAEGVREKVNEALPGLELSTVYRILDALGEAGLVVDSRLPDGPRFFEARTSAHPHLVCDSCGGIFHPELEVDIRLLEALSANSPGFEVRELHVVARGTCASCVAAGGGS